jgi:dTDP-4-amino-4,6-dideoxygalactose transaminase|tara:strand:- start:87152 stop:88264 length:1113 start_codon:yes stop_codon:yes gene_type:complete
MGGKEQEYIQEAFDTNWIAPLGPNIQKFEESIENYLVQDKHVVALSSGTAAIHLALIMAGVVLDDEVLCQSFTFSASVNPISYQGAKPVFIDSESETWNMSPIHLESAIVDSIEIGKKPKAIIVVHLYGMPAKIDKIAVIAKKYEIPLIEDAAEVLGSSYKGQKCGTFGDYGILSFNGNKIITTSGGGALVCNSINDKERGIYLASQARDEAPHYQHSEIGYNYRMSNVVAGIGRGQMEVLDKHINLRRKNNQFYQELFKDIEGVTVFIEKNDDFYSNHWLSCILIDENLAGFNREDIRLALLKANIESRPLWKPMHLQPVFSTCSYFGTEVSENIFKAGLCLPSGSNLSELDKEFIKNCILEFIQSVNN